MKNKKGWFVLAVWGMVATIFLLTDSVSAAEKVYKWRAVTHQLVGTARYKGTVVPFCEMVKKASNGRLIIEPYGAGVLFPVPESFDAVRDGVVQMAMVWGGYWAGKDPVFALSGSRPGDPIMEFAENFYLSEKEYPLVAKVYEKFSVKSLGGFDFGHLYTLPGHHQRKGDIYPHLAQDVILLLAQLVVLGQNQADDRHQGVSVN